MANTKITTAVIKDDAITTAKIADDAVTGALIADDVALAGNPTTTTQSAGNNTTRIATTAFVTTAINNLVDSAPAALDTLNELAAAMGDDANFSTTVTNSIATKLPLAGGTMTGNIAHASDFTLDVEGDLNLDAAGGQLNFKDSGTTRVTFELDATPEVSFTGGNLAFNNLTQNADIAFKGFDDSSFITALNLDMSEAGFATFNDGATFSPNSGTLDIKVGTHDATNNVRLNAGGTTSTYLEYRGYLGHIFDVDTTRRMTLTSTGLGIGSDNPNTALHIVGLNQTNGTLDLTPNAAKGSHSSFVHYGTNGDWYVRSASASGNVYIQDTGGNVLVGTTDTTLYNNTSGGGIGLMAANRLDVARAGDVVATFNRMTDAGQVIQLYQAGSLAGGLGVSGTDATIGTGDTGITFEDAADVVHPVNFTTGAARDAAVSLGKSAARFKDLYLANDIAHLDAAGNARLLYDKSANLLGNAGTNVYANGIYLGGTGSANLLDDYEEGVYGTSFNCSVSGSITLNGAYNNMQYTKVGRLVTVTGYFIVSSVSSPNGVLQITVPFQSVNTSSNSSSVDLSFNVLSTGSLTDAWGIIDHNSNTINVYVGSGTSVSTSFANRIVSGTDLRLTATYIAA